LDATKTLAELDRNGFARLLKNLELSKENSSQLRLVGARLTKVAEVLYSKRETARAKERVKKNITK